MARDIFHTLVKEALENEDWIITHDPFPLLRRKDGGLQTDLGAKKSSPLSGTASGLR
ncbi:MAG: element excision factor XisH family protein [Saprospiraceae bacterium]